MRRKTKAVTEAAATPEKRRSTRGRGRRSPTPSPTPEENEQQQEVVEKPEEPKEEEEPKRRGRRTTRTPSADVAVVTPRRGRRKKTEVIVEEEEKPVEVVAEPEPEPVKEASPEPEPPLVEVEVEPLPSPERPVPEEPPSPEKATSRTASPEMEEDNVFGNFQLDQLGIMENVQDLQEAEPEVEPAVEQQNSPEPQEEQEAEKDEEEEVEEEKPVSPASEDAMEIHAEEEISQQAENPIATTEENSRDDATPTVKDSEAEEGEVIDESSEDKHYEEEPAPRPQKPMRKMRLNNDRRVSNEQKKSADASVDKKSESDAADSATASTENAADKENAPRPRKRKWLTQKSTEAKPAIISISTDSLKNIIKDVKPVPLADVKLDLTPERPKEDKEASSSEPEPEKKQRKVSLSSKPDETPKEINNKEKVKADEKEKPFVPKPFTPPKNKASTILYITNLVRPFTVLQLKGLLARTGKIVENGFWIDKIKSKCYVKYENEDEATETRHALHGVRWPASNPKTLHVDFGRDTDMEKAVMSSLDETVTRTITNDVATRGEETNNSFGWSKADAYRTEVEEKAKQQTVVRPVREWDLGKQRTEDKDRDRRREKDRERDRRGDRENDRSRDRTRDRRRTPEVRRSRSLSADRAQRKKEEPPLRLLDDLFRKTKATPCVYWLPLTSEQIQEKEELRKKRLEEQEARQETQRKQREEEIKKRQRERERRRSASREREREKRRRSRTRSRSRSRSTRRRYR